MIAPGWLLARLSLPTGSPERFLLAFGLGFCGLLVQGALLTIMAVSDIARPVQQWHIAILANIVVLGLLGVVQLRRIPLNTRWDRPGWPLIAILGLAGFLRLTDLGWSEFQGDEARVLLRAMAAIQGVPDALLAHRKVPGEILVALPLFGQMGAMTELVGRLPFALSGVAAVAAFYMLARELFDEHVALVAGLLLAINGYSVAFGRILQYDSLSFFLGCLGLICGVRFWRGEGSATRLAIAGSVLLCCSGLIALGAMFFAIPAALLVAGRIVQVKQNRVRLACLWMWPGFLAVLAVVAVIVVEVIGRRTGGVLSYLGPRLGGDHPYWHGTEFLVSANHYLSTPYLWLTLGGGTLAVLLVLAARLRDGGVRLAVAAITLGLVAAAGSWTKPAAVSLVAALIILAIVLTTSRKSLGYRAVILWAAAPLLMHTFLIRVPGTHWREAFPGLVLLTAGLLVSTVPPGPVRRLASGAGVVFIVAVTSFSWTTLVQRWPEYQMEYPEQRHWLDWTNASGRGIGGVFGVSHHHGWKTLAILQAHGQIPPSYATNESPAIAAWYLRRPQGCPLPIAVILRTPRPPQDRNLSVPVPLPPGYVNAGNLTLTGHNTVTLQVHPASPTRFGNIPADVGDAEWTQTMSSPWRPVGNFYQADLGAAANRLGCQPGIA